MDDSSLYLLKNLFHQLNYTAVSPTHSLEAEFLRLMISSHLMTFGRSVVMGRQAEQVNVLVYTLGLFCWDSERLCSRAALTGRDWPYFQDLGVQGCLKVILLLLFV